MPHKLALVPAMCKINCTHSLDFGNKKVCLLPKLSLTVQFTCGKVLNIVNFLL